jgi:uncharacterized membrane protein (UPF0127 family)
VAWAFWPTKYGYPYVKHALTIEGEEYAGYIAQTPDLHQSGLRPVPSLDTDEAMLFIFEEDVSIPFTMRGMQYPIHIIFLNENGMVLGGRVNAQPGQEFISSPEPYRYVLELPVTVEAPRPGLVIELSNNIRKYE